MYYIQKLESLLSTATLNKSEREALIAFADSLVMFQENRKGNRTTLIKALLNLLDQGKLRGYFELILEICPKSEGERKDKMNNFYDNMD